ncbi:MAG: YdcF family protein [Bacteroidetes bacterium]|nr:MAG: YdcF family protein [Bacteroidota bacterium]
MMSTPFLFQAIAGKLEAEYPPFQVANCIPCVEGKEVHIYILGAGHSVDERYEAGQLLSNAAKSRVFEAMRIGRMLPNALFITSASAPRGGITQAECTKRALQDLGVDSIRIQLNPEATDTESEAKRFVQAYGQNTPVILVTSALHQRRAKSWFEKAGVKEIYSAPSDYAVFRGQGYRWTDYLPRINQLLAWDALIKEKLGMWEVGVK